MALWVLSLLLVALTLWLEAGRPSLAGRLPLVAEVLAFTSAGALIAWRRPRNPIGWLLLAEGLAWELIGVLDAVVRHAVPGSSGEALAAWLLNWVWIAAFVVLVLFFLLFPDARLPGPRWRVVPRLAAAGALATFVARALTPGPLAEAPAVANPLGLRGAAGFLRMLEAVGSPLLGLMVVAAVASLAMRFRRAGGAERRQLVWLALSGALVVAGSGLLNLLQLAGLAGRLDTGDLFLASMAGIPVGAAVAVLRYRLYDVDLVVGRTVVLAGLLAFITAVYLALVVGVGTTVGRGSGSNVVLAVVATALVALAFQPLRARLEGLARRLLLEPPRTAGDEVGVAVRCLGAFRVLRGGQPLPASAWQSRKARTLVKILIARRGRATSRELLVETLWPGEPPEVAGRRLSVAMATARAVLDPGKRHPADWFVVADKEALRVDLANLPVDVERFLALAGEGLERHRAGQFAEAGPALRAAEAIYAGDFLEEDPYEEWAEPLREEARAARAAAIRALAEVAESAGAHDEAVRCHLRLLEHDPFDERAHLALVATLQRGGRHGEARRRYRAYAARMRELEVPAAPFPAPDPAKAPSEPRLNTT